MLKVNNISNLDNYTLPYPIDALEPIITAESLEQHLNGHLKVYVQKLKVLLEERKIFQSSSLTEIIMNSYGDYELMPIYNNAAQIYAHILFWESLRPFNDSYKGEMSAALINYIEKSFGSIQEFHKQIVDKSINLFGNGWLWLILNDEDKLELLVTVNAFNPLNIDSVSQVLICIDLWEHAYYPQFLHLRRKYVEEIYKLINWNHVSNLITT